MSSSLMVTKTEVPNVLMSVTMFPSLYDGVSIFSILDGVIWQLKVFEDRKINSRSGASVTPSLGGHLSRL